MRVNGTEQSLTQPTTLAQFLAQQGYRVERIVVERNGEIVPKAAYASVQLCDSDVIEIVSFMGGG